MQLPFDEDFKWHHFAFEADAARVRELREALAESLPWGELAPLRAFYDRHAGPYFRAEREHVEVVAAAELEVALAGAARVLGALGHGEAIAAAAARARGLTAGAGVAVRSVAWPRLCSGRLERLVELGAPEVLVEAEIEAMTEAARWLFDAPPEADEPASTSASLDDDPYACFEGCVELCCLPFAPNVGLGGLYELFNPVGRMYFRGEDPFWSDALMPPTELVDRSVPVHHELADTVATLGVASGGPIAWAEAEALEAFARRLRDAKLDLSGLDRMRDECGNEESPTDFSIVHGVDQPDIEATAALVEARVRRYAARCEEIAARSGALLTFIGKNPAL